MKKQKYSAGKLIATLALAPILVACGGSGGSDDAGPFVPTGSAKTVDITYGPSGAATNYVSYMNDAAHRPIRAVSQDIGPDMLPFTSDDVITGYTDFRYDAHGKQVLFHYVLADGLSRQTQGLSYTTPGTDGIWFTDDDTIHENADGGTGYGVHTFNASGSVLRTAVYKDAGADSKWLTADDSVDYYIDFFPGAEPFSTTWRMYREVGADGRWFTSDDVMSNHFDGEKFFSGAGPDGVWLTDDDVPQSYLAVETDAATGVTYRKQTFAGPDQILFTNDDIARSDYGHGYADGKLVFIFSRSAGVDGILDTDDDRWSTIPTKTDFDDAGRPTKTTMFSSAGADQRFLTDDDVVSGYTTISYRDNGDLLQRTEFVGAGDNGVWFDEDDVVGAYEISEVASGFLSSIKRYTTPGDNGTWFDDDDGMVKETRYSLY